MATTNAAKALGVDHIIGNFVRGKYFDAMIVDVEAENSSVCRSEGESFEVSLMRSVSHVVGVKSSSN